VQKFSVPVVIFYNENACNGGGFHLTKEIKKGLAMMSEENVRRKYQKVLADGWYTKDQLNIVRPSIFQQHLQREKTAHKNS